MRKLIHMPGLLFLLILIAIISFVSIKPQFYTVGWDNYSSYLDIPLNIIRTFFATWRDYRGLGVPSDSESTDLFRQLFYLLASPIVPQTILDQLYMTLSFSLGAVTAYVFFYILFGKYWKSKKIADMGAFIGSFFYIFNLNTLAAFYFPMVMYINRFFSIPLLFLSLFILATFKHISTKLYLFIIFSFLITSGTYLTATIFITMILALILFGICLEFKKRFFMGLIFYVLIQTFWLLPFTNYTLSKASIIRLAPTFIEANETQLNKPASFYDLKKQLILYPNFFDTTFTNLKTLEKTNFHQLAAEYNKLPTMVVLFIFPALYLLGSIIIIFKRKNYQSSLWVPLIIFIFLFLSLKEFSPLGFLYSFLDSSIPYFSVLFRFGDTKFHAFIAFAGSFSAAFALVSIVNVWNLIKKSSLLIIILPTLFVFRYYLEGSLIGSFMYNKIPQAYFEIVNTINSDQEPSRVLHLPMDSTAYWKSYSWGAFGSSFLNFMLSRPLIDKTFEPASMENAYLDQQIEGLLAHTQFLKTTEQKKEKAKLFAALLKKTNIKYLIIDGTVESTIDRRNMVLWGKFKTADTQKMASYLVEYGLARKLKEYNVQQKKIQLLVLLVLNSTLPRIGFVKEAISIDPSAKNLFGLFLDSSITTMQNPKDLGYSIFPFQRQNISLTNSDNKFNLHFEKLPHLASWGTVTLPKVSNISSDRIINYIDVYAQKGEENIRLSFYLRKLPEIDNTLYLQKLTELDIPLSVIANDSYAANLGSYFSDWSKLNFQDIGPLRIRLGNTVIPVPAKIALTEQYITTVIVQGDEVPVNVLALNKRIYANPKDFSATENPNCFSDRLEDAKYVIEKDPSFTIISQNQSTCFYYDLKPFLDVSTAHAELWFQVKGESADLDSSYQPRQTALSAPKPNIMRLCVKEPHIDDCYNNHQLVRVNGQQIFALPLEKPLDGTSDMSILLSLKNTGYQKQKIEINNMAVDQYVNLSSTVISFDPNQEVKLPLDLLANQPLAVSIPKAFGNSAFTFQPDKEGLYVSNKPCEKDGYRTFRTINNIFLSYVENCYNQMFQPSSFSSDRFYLWEVEYNLLSGKFPRFVLGDGFYSYLSQYLSIDQGYPDIQGFKTFKNPDKLSDLKYQTAFVYSYPRNDLDDQKEKEFTLHQDSENEGVMAIRSFVFQPLPTQWERLFLNIGNTKKTFLTTKDYKSEQIIPSLRKVSVKLPKKGDYLLIFREGFDKQWKLIKNPWEMIDSLKCDGFANCFVINKKENNTSGETFYLFYTPEILNGFGWILTIGSILVFRKAMMRLRTL